MRRISLLKAIRPRIHVRAEGLEPSSSSEHRLLRPACFPDFTTPAYADSVGGETADIRFVVDNDKMRPPCEVRDVLALAARGMTASEIARHAEIPRSTIRDWLNDPQPSRRSRDCAGAHDLSLLEASPYAYLLGMYLGDGCISRCPRDVWRLRITLDAAYPGIVAECVGAVEAVASRQAGVYRRRDCRAIEVFSHWKHWPCLIPQHGPGRKHERRIVLADWQRQVVSANPELFLRGLIHSDGTRIIATERKGSYVRRAPRYAFSNRSEDILELFRAGCEATGVHCTRSSVKQISIYSKAAVARLDEFIGPKT